MKFEELILSLNKYFYLYKSNKLKLKPYKIIEIFWDAGDSLKYYLSEHNIKKHTLFREIYGKSEGSKNIQQKSYITREFQTRSLRIRELFKNKSDIKKTYKNLQNTSYFMQSMPFFDNDKYKLSNKEMKKLKKLLNHSDKYELKNYINYLRNQYIKIEKKSIQSSNSMKAEVRIFVTMYNKIYIMLNKKNKKQIINYRNRYFLSNEFLSSLSHSVSSLTGDEKIGQEIIIDSKIPKQWRLFAKSMNKIANGKNAVLKRRFRRIVPNLKLDNMAEMLYKFSTISKDQYE